MRCVGRLVRCVPLLVLACGSDPVVLTGEPGSCGDSQTYQTVGQPFALNYCTGCHSQHLPEGSRFGAPAGVDFDTLEGIRTHSDRFLARAVVDRDMPPGGGPSDQELEDLSWWVACGAAGDSNPLPVGRIDTALVQGYNIRIEIGEGSLGNVGEPAELELLLTRVLDDVNTDWREGSYSVEAYLLTEDEAWLTGMQRMDEEGEVFWQVQWDPPLPVAGAAIEGDLSVTAHLEDSEGSEVIDQEWTVSTGEAVDLDGQSTDTAPSALWMVEAGGEEHGWHLSDDFGVVERWTVWTDGTMDTYLQQPIDVQVPDDMSFPIEEGVSWIERLVVTELAQ
jgi:hypothetical protein